MSRYPNSNPDPAPKPKSPALLIAAVLGVLVLVGAGVVLMLMMNNAEPQQAPHSQPTPATRPVAVELDGPAIEVDANEMLNLFRDQPAEAEAKYKGRVVDVTGSLKAKLDSNFAGERALALEGGVQRFAGVRCILPEANYFQMDEVEPGQTVTVRGRCEGLVSDIILQDCAVLRVAD